MINYIRAEIYRASKKKTSIVLVVLGLLAILFAWYNNQTIRGDVDQFFSGISRLIEGLYVIIGCIIASLFTKPNREIKNYLQKGNSRFKMVLGDFILGVITTIIYAVLMLFIVYLIGATIDGNLSFNSNHFIGLLKKVGISLIGVIFVISASQLCYTLNNNMGLSVAVSFLFYVIIPAIAVGLQMFETIVGTISKYILKLSIISFNMQIKTAGRIEDIKWFTISLLINILLLFIIRYLYIRKKNL